jgi:hypothetical protein
MIQLGLVADLVVSWFAVLARMKVYNQYYQVLPPNLHKKMLTVEHR